MKINLVSDLHLEVKDLQLPGGEVLIIAGDACEARNVKSHLYHASGVYSEKDSYREDRFARFFIEECAKYDQVFYVMGNHEHYKNNFDKTYVELNSNLPVNVFLLENECSEYKDVLFVGCTLWTDLNNEDPMTEMIVKNGMNDYQLVTFCDERNNYRRLLPTDTKRVHYKSRKYIETIAQNNKDKKIVVITHHAPSFSSIHPMYIRDREMNGGYASNLDNLILDNPNIKVWNHGHVHHKFDYMIGDCRILCNPRGYVGYESSTFDVNFTFEI